MSHFAELLPEQLDVLWEQGAPAIVAWGALEWHGSHLPLGLDGIVAAWFAERLVERAEGVLLPPIWLPMTTLPHRHSLQIRTETFRLLLDEVLVSLYDSGARKICLVSGHYAQGHQVEMAEAALRAMEDYEGLKVYCGAPLELLGNAEFLDHAAHYETSQLLAIRPELVFLARIDPAGLSAHDSAVLGSEPSLGSAEEGKKLLQAGLESWAGWIRCASQEDLESHYKSVFDRYAAYMEAYYKGSWEEALQRWWADQ